MSERVVVIYAHLGHLNDKLDKFADSLPREQHIVAASAPTVIDNSKSLNSDSTICAVTLLIQVGS
jgi:hypothetical protein